MNTTASQSCLGRRKLLSRLEEHVETGRCVDLVGPPGIGKSVVAGELVRRRRAAGEQWVILDLQAHPSIDDAVAALADRRAVDTGDVSSTGKLARRIGSRLDAQGVDGLLFDQADPFTEHAGLVKTFIESAIGVAWLATSRSPLFEHSPTLRVGPLSRQTAIALYRRTARGHWVGAGPLEITDEEIGRLVDELDCHPQAIDVAASRINTSPPAAFLDRYSTDTASPSAVDFAPLDGLLAEAWQQFPDERKRILQVCSRFADAVPLDLVDILDSYLPDVEFEMHDLEPLIRSGWLRPAEAYDSRVFRLPSLLAGFVQKTRTPAFDPEQTHAAAVIERAEQLLGQLSTDGNRSAFEGLRTIAADLLLVYDRFETTAPERATRALVSLRWLARLGHLEPPVRRRLSRALSRELPEHSPPRLGALLEAFAGEVRYRAGHVDEAAEICASAHRRLPETTDPAIRAEVLLASCLPLGSLDPEAAQSRLEQAAEASERADWPLMQARVAERAGFAALGALQLPTARQQLLRARDLLDELDDELFLPPVLTGLGYVAHRLDLPESARNSLRRALALYRQTDRRSRAAGADFNLGVVLLAHGHRRSAREHLERAVRNLGESGTPGQAAAARIHLALTDWELDDLDRARTHLRDALAIAQECGDRHNQALAEATLATLRDDGARGEQFEIPLDDLHLETAPDAAAAFLGFSALCFAFDHAPERARRQVRKIAGLREQLSEDDHYLRHVIETIRSACLQTLRASGLDDLPAPDMPSPTGDEPPDNPFARLLVPLLEVTEGEEASSRIIPAQQERSLQLRVHERGHWFRVEGESPVDLTSRGPLRRILGAIVAISGQSGSAGTSVEDLIEAGWPDATPTRSSGANRVYYSIRKLREMGLDDILVTGDAGYHFAETTELRISRAPYEQVTAGQ